MRQEVLPEWPGIDRQLTKKSDEGLGKPLSCSELIETDDEWWEKRNPYAEKQNIQVFYVNMSEIMKALKGISLNKR